MLALVLAILIAFFTSTTLYALLTEDGEAMVKGHGCILLVLIAIAVLYLQEY